MLLKGFFRKKTTKVYLIVLIAITSVFMIVTYSRFNYILKANKSFSDARIVFVAPKEEYEKVKKIKNVKDITLGIIPILPIDSDNWFYMGVPKVYLDNTLKDNEVIVGHEVLDNNEKNYEPTFFGKKYNLEVVKHLPFYENKYEVNLNEIYVSREIYKELSSKTDVYYYVLKLKDWLKYDKTFNDIEENIDLNTYDIDLNGTNYQEEMIDAKNNNYGNIIFFSYASMYTIANMALLGLFIIVLVITIHNILVDEEVSTYLYSCLGYNKKKIRKINLLKILIVMVIAIIIAIIITMLYALLFNHA